jgi:hypothetical protein
MPIKRSVLEQKLMYRIGKVLVLLLPFIVGAILYVARKLTTDDILKNVVFEAIGLIAYYILLKAIWRLVLYIVFGGLEDDIKKKKETIPAQVAQAVQPGSQTPPKRNAGGGIAALIIIIIIIFLVAYFSDAFNTNTNISTNTNTKNSNSQIITNNPTPSNNNSKPTTCIPTGCGTDWNCSGYYYIDNVRIPVNGCFKNGARPGDFYSSWSGTCRQCP